MEWWHTSMSYRLQQQQQHCHLPPKPFLTSSLMKSQAEILSRPRNKLYDIKGFDMQGFNNYLIIRPYYMDPCNSNTKGEITNYLNLKLHCFHNIRTLTDAQAVNFNSHNPYPTAFPYGNGMVLHFYQQQESSTTKTVHNKVINKGLKAYV